ncbi:rod shape-determining protein MreD [Lactobacillus sp. LC28-10]|uniref:Rod shape-determining protein MreD n=1 Tax=Secundilactobacillus angelensis TaxID=2722706 RepID=A0ABX1KYV3_9LACO|nr:rod shape-determining protein MreD [Secundilactobacillus angelensis]MCH5462064.1 rod shape-determining protein MreD [Secundilactobacillus angelensis]NLR18455.1 rod shape-determining protein MreD [Secundilactobacillus angelensis]
MVRVTKLRYGFPIGLFLFFYLDGILGAVFPQQLFSVPYSMSSYLVVLWLVFAVFFEDQIQIPLSIWAAVAGGLFDVYYTGIWGIFVFVFPIVVALTRACYKAFPINFLSGLLVYFIDITVVCSLSYIGNLVVHMTSASFADMMVDSLAPTLAYNLAAYVILYFPVQWVFNRLKN